ncbi:MAG: M16 family metallopeptidase [Candidatus Aminicenantia bacterium]
MKNSNGWLGIPFALKKKLRKILFFLLLGVFLIFSSLLGQESFRKFPPNPEPLKEVKFPKELNYKLANGLEIDFVSQKNLPFITFYLIVFAGESHSPVNYPGLATFTARMLNKGSVYQSSGKITENIESIGGKFLIHTELDYSVYNFTFLEEHFDEALKILQKILLEPTFPQREIEIERRNILFELRKKRTEPKFLAQERLFQVLFNKEHPYSHPYPVEESVKSITREEIYSFYKTYYRPNNSILVIVGSLGFKQLIRKVSHYLNIWQPKEVSSLYFPSVKPHNKEVLYLIDFPGLKYSMVYLGNIVFERNNDHFFPLLVLNQILGGTTNSRLFMNLRESKEYAYSAISRLNFFKRNGIYTIEVKVKPEVIKEAIQECFLELDKIIKGVPNFEVEQAKYYLIGNFPFKLETPEALAEYTAQRIIFNLPTNYWDKYQEKVMMIDQEVITQIAREYFSNIPAIVIVGDRKVILDSLLDFEEIEVYDINGNLKYSLKKGVD